MPSPPSASSTSPARRFCSSACRRRNGGSERTIGCSSRRSLACCWRWPECASRCESLDGVIPMPISQRRSSVLVLVLVLGVSSEHEDVHEHEHGLSEQHWA